MVWGRGGGGGGGVCVRKEGYPLPGAKCSGLGCPQSSRHLPFLLTPAPEAKSLLKLPNSSQSVIPITAGAKPGWAWPRSGVSRSRARGRVHRPPDPRVVVQRGTPLPAALTSQMCAWPM